MVIYGGDLDCWIAAARSLKAKYYIHLQCCPTKIFSSLQPLDFLDVSLSGPACRQAGSLQPLSEGGSLRNQKIKRLQSQSYFSRTIVINLKVSATAYQDALDAINSGAISSEAENLQQFFASGANNPRYEFDLNRAGNILWAIISLITGSKR